MRHTIRRATRISIIVLYFSLWLTSLGASQASTTDFTSLYQEACATCHGAVGSGMATDDPRYETFDPPPSDFTDPLFNSREPAADWFLVVKFGGVSLGLSDQMPAYGEAYSDSQIEGLVAFAKGLAKTDGYPPGELNLVRPIRSIKAFPEDEVVVQYRAEARNGNDPSRLAVEVARRVGKRAQLEGILIYSDDGTNERLRELEIGFKWPLRWSLEKNYLITVGAEAELPLESAGSEVLVPFVSFAKVLGDFSLQGTGRLNLPFDSSSDESAEISAVIHWLTRDPMPRGLYPGLEFVVGEAFHDSRGLESSVLPQVMLVPNKGGHLGLTVGLELPISNLDYDYRVHAFFVWDFADGPIWSGW